MIKIEYSKKEFRCVIANYIRSHSDYKDDIGFLEVMHLFENEEKVTIRRGMVAHELVICDSNDNAHIIRFSNSPFCSFYENVLQSLYLYDPKYFRSENHDKVMARLYGTENK